MKKTTRALILCLAGSLSGMGVMQSAQAALIGTEAIAAVAAPEVAAQDVQAARARIDATLARDDVAQALSQRGVDLDQARARVAAMTDAEALAFDHQLATAPAGASDILGTIVFIFVLLVITDILGFTKVFPFTRSIR